MSIRIAFPMAIQVYEGPLYMERTEDGETSRFYYYVGGRFADGTQRTHERAFRDRRDAENLAYRVNMAGVINPEHWFEGSAWDAVEAEIRLADEYASMGASEADLERMGLA